MTATPSFTALLGGRLRALRRRHFARRGIEVLALAVAADLLLDLAALLAFLSWGKTIRVPFFMPILLAVLLVREARTMASPLWPRFLDRTFGLKERMDSFRWYGRAGTVPPSVREAQAEETLRAVDWGLLRRRLGLRVPPGLFISLPAFILLLLLGMGVEDGDFVPPGPVGRMGMQVILPSRAPSLPGGPAGEGRETRVTPGTSPSGTAGAQSGSAMDKRAATPPGDPKEKRREDGREAVLKSPPAVGAAPEKPPLPPGRPPGAFPEDAEDMDLSDRELQSQRVGEKAAPVAPPRLLEDPLFNQEALREAGQLASLLPWLVGNASSPLDTSGMEFIGRNLERYPIKYRAHLARYYRELNEWRSQ